MTLSKAGTHRRTLTALALSAFLAVLVLTPIAVAQPPEDPGNRPAHAGPPQDVVDQLLDRGFRQVQPSIFERQPVDTPTSYETVVYGVDGHLWLLGQQEAFLETLQARYDQYPAPEMLDAILAQETRIEENLALIDEMRAQGTTGGQTTLDNGLTAVRLGSGELISVGEAVTSCTTTLQRTGSAGATSTGPTATGSSSFNDTCTEVGTVSSTATAQGTDSIGNINTYTQTCPSATGGNVSCNATASVNAVTACFSNGQGSVTFGFFTYTASETNSICRPLTASLTGTTSIYVPRGSSRTGFWSVSASNGSTPYSYQWLYNNAAVGTNSTSYSRSYPHPGIGYVRFDTVKVTVADSSNPTQTVTKQLTVRVEYENLCIDPCFCPISAASVYGINPESIVQQPCQLEP